MSVYSGDFFSPWTRKHKGCCFYSFKFPLEPLRVWTDSSYVFSSFVMSVDCASFPSFLDGSNPVFDRLRIALPF